MIIGGLLKTSFSEYPGKVAAVVFTMGCNFRCPWCHNPGLVDPMRYVHEVPVRDVLQFLEGRRKFLDAVVVSGGEPTLQADILSFLRELKSMGYAVKLDTNGSRPDVLEKLLGEGLADCVAVDYKVPFGLYRRVLTSGYTGAGPCNPNQVKASIAVALGHSESYIRTTVVPDIHTPEVLGKMRNDLEKLVRPGVTVPEPGSGKWRLQEFRDTGDLLGPRVWERPGFLAWFRRQSGSRKAGRVACGVRR
ncbi:pyruvate formate lyase activating enzyme [Thermanaeromonas toyohensis ToBE]|uniref:Pyruvate formate lyase activating enzyme n=1 Tax=Thermanaeromonas toyohensis ToBE TaxID=698762 RepID=A0A1W1VU50_9FIRM|nr:anaerobic ribonucleoside-triphosphate reductase activating protein [Thermanaeromonas toyohensis]SMB96424.1 pyruvate formate lyase activating enzyme [Thermanaeromonas toyohensis ToBE]